MVGINFQVVQVGHGQNMSKCQIPQETDFGWPQRCFFSALINYSTTQTVQHHPRLRNTSSAVVTPPGPATICNVQLVQLSDPQERPLSKNDQTSSDSRETKKRIFGAQKIWELHGWWHKSSGRGETFVITTTGCELMAIVTWSIGLGKYTVSIVHIHYLIRYDQIWSDMSIWIYSHVQSRDSYRYSHVCWLIALAEASSGSSHTWRKLPYLGSFKLVLIPMCLALAPFLEKTVFFWLLPPVLLVKNHSLLVHMSTFCGSKLQKLPVFVA